MMVNGSCEKCLQEMAEIIERRDKDEWQRGRRETEIHA